MKKFLIEFQLEDQAPEHRVVSGKSQKDAEINLSSILCKELVDQGVEQWEADSCVEKLTILEIKKI